jgi:cytochrome c6
MKKVFTALLLAFVLLMAAFQPAALAEPDLAIGAKVFSANCAACHMGGGNVVAANKNLKAETLKQYSMDSAEAVINQVTNGKNAMPAFKSRLTAEQIESVAAYVLAQAEKGWTK